MNRKCGTKNAVISLVYGIHKNILFFYILDQCYCKFLNFKSFLTMNHRILPNYPAISLSFSCIRF